MEVEPLSHQEILAFQTLHKLEMESFDITMLQRLDGIWFASLPKKEPPPGREVGRLRDSA